MLNQVTIIGTIIKEISMNNSGNYISGNLQVQVNGQYFPEYIDVLAYGKYAEVLQFYTRQGSRVYIEGYLKYFSERTYNGENITYSKVVVEKIILLGKKSQ